MNKSKALRALDAQLDEAKAALSAVIAKAEATEAEIVAATEKVKNINAKIASQEVLDKGKVFDESGDEVIDKTPVNEPVFAQPKDHKGPFNSLGEQMLAIVRSTPKDGAPAPVDARLIAVQNASGANEAIPSEGGFLVQKEFSSEIQEVDIS